MSLLREKMLIQQLDDSNEKTLQLEKTAKWWSDCTVRWREKWGRVKTQKDKLHEEVDILKGRNKALIMEYKKLQNDNKKLRVICHNEKEEKQVARVEPIIEHHISNHVNQNESNAQSTNLKKPEVSEQQTSEKPSSPSKPKPLPILSEEFENIESVLDNLEFTDKPWIDRETGHTKIIDEETYMILNEKLTRVKTYLVECNRNVEETNQVNEDLKSKLGKYECNNQSNSGDEDVKSSPTKGESSSFNVKIRNLHSEIQRLQKENYKEWALREERDTELSNVNRELTKAHQTINDLRVEILKKELSRSEVVTSKVLNKELDKKTLELIELKSTFNKTMKILDEKIEENKHERRRNEQYENEVKKLRTKIDRLKNDLSIAEEKIDFQAGQNRRLQRAFDEILQRNENLQLQLKQTTSRLKYQK